MLRRGWVVCVVLMGPLVGKGVLKNRFSFWHSRLLALEKEHVKACNVLLHDIVLQVGEKDGRQWNIQWCKRYSSSLTYNYLTSLKKVSTQESSNIIWHKAVPLKISLFWLSWFWTIWNERNSHISLSQGVLFTSIVRHDQSSNIFVVESEIFYFYFWQPFLVA